MPSETSSRRRKSQDIAVGDSNSDRATTHTYSAASRRRQKQRRNPGKARTMSFKKGSLSVSSLFMCCCLALFLACWAVFARYVLHGWMAKDSSLPFHRGAGASVSSLPADFYALPCQEDSIQELRVPSFDMFHVIITPFWVGTQASPLLHQNATIQGYQNARTRARYRMLETFAAPSLRNQTLSHFLWIIIVDDATLQEPAMLADLTQLLEEHNRGYPTKNAVLLKHRTSASMLGESLMMEAPRQHMVQWRDVVIEYAQGNLEILMGYGDMWNHCLERTSFSGRRSSTTSTTTEHNTTPKLLLETMLAVDSGLHRRSVEWMQIMASRYAVELQQSNNNSNQKSYLRPFLSASPPQVLEWYMCGASALEWHNPDILLIKQNVYEEQGISVGKVGRREVTTGCPWAGATRVSSIVEDPLSTAAISKEKDIVPQSLPLCDGSGYATNCLLRIPFPMPIVVQGYSMVKDGIETATAEDFVYMNVLATRYDAVEGPMSWNQTELLWELLGDHFGMDRYDVWHTSVYLFQHTEEILWGNPCSALQLQLLGEVSTSHADEEVSSLDQYCTGAVRKSQSDLAKYVHARRAITTSMVEARLAKLRKAKLAELQQRQQQQKQAAAGAAAGIGEVSSNATVSGR